MLSTCNFLDEHLNLFKCSVLLIASMRDTHTVFNLITAPALITAPRPLNFYFILTYYRPVDDLFPDISLYFHLLSPT